MNEFQEGVLRAIASQQEQAVELARVRYALDETRTPMVFDIRHKITVNAGRAPKK